MDGTPGNYGIDFPSFTGRLAVKLANGRLPMLTIIGVFFQDGLVGSAWGRLGTFPRLGDPCMRV